MAFPFLSFEKRGNCKESPCRISIILIGYKVQSCLRRNPFTQEFTDMQHLERKESLENSSSNQMKAGHGAIADATFNYMC